MRNAAVGDGLRADGLERTGHIGLRRQDEHAGAQLGQLGRHVVGTQRLDDDALGGVLDAERARKDVHIGLGRRVDGEQWRGQAAAGAAVVDDHTLALLGHAGQHDGRHLGHRRHVAVDHVGHRALRLGEYVKVLRMAVAHAHIVDQHADVELANFSFDLRVDRALLFTHLEKYIYAK